MSRTLRRTGGLESGDRAIEWLCAGVMVWWAVALALPGEVLSQPAFVAFARFGLTPDQWTLIFAAMGGGRIVALFINGRWPRTPYIRMASSMFGAIAWGQLSFLFFESSLINHGPFQTGMGVYGLFALAEIFSTFRAAHDARYYNP